MKPRPGTWPVAPERMAERQQWVDRYEAMARSYAACRFIDTIGSGSVDREVREVQELHDEMNGAHGELSIA